MFFSKKTTYSLRALLNLIPTYPDGCISVTTIARKEKISKKFLDQLFSQLNKVDIIKSKKGKYGGFCLNRHPGEILLIDIIEALDGPIAVAECANQYMKCAMRSDCKVNLLISDLQLLIKKYLERLTLKSLFERVPENLPEYSI
jgi:Rrf2 family protein